MRWKQKWFNFYGGQFSSLKYGYVMQKSHILMILYSFIASSTPPRSQQ